MRAIEAVYCVVKVTGGQETFRFGFLGHGHFNHSLGEHQESNRCFGLIRMDKRRFKRALLGLGIEKLPDCPVPVENLKDTRELVSIHKFVQGRLHDPELAMIVDDDLLPEPVVPESKHNINQHLFNYILGDVYRSRHPYVMIGMRTIAQWIMGKIYGPSCFFGVPSHCLDDLGNHEIIQSRHGMHAMILRASHGDEHNIVFPAILDKPLARRGLNVTARLAEFRWRGDLIILKDTINILL